MDFYTHYARLEGNAVVEYPVNPRVFIASTGDYNIPFNWEGGTLDGKTYVFCHNQEPQTEHTEVIVETTPYFDAVQNLWYRGYEKRPASPELVAERVAVAEEFASKRIVALLKRYSAAQAEALELSESQKNDWASFRKALPSVLEQPGFPMQITWPMPPDASENDMKLEVARI